jgi:hypothetical protein
MITQSLKYNAEMLFPTLRKDQDVINEDHNKLIQLFHENRVHQVHEVSRGVGEVGHASGSFSEVGGCSETCRGRKGEAG